MGYKIKKGHVIMSLHGNLEDLPFADLIEIATRREQSCILHFSEIADIPSLAATVIIQNGKVYASWVYQKRENSLTTLYEGENALHALLVCHKAIFNIKILTSDYAFPAQNVFSPVNELLLANVFQAELFQAMWQEQITGWEILSASKQLRPQQYSSFNKSQTQENTIKIKQEIEITARTHQNTTASSYRSGNDPVSAPAQLPPADSERVMPAPLAGNKIQRGWISSLMAKLRSL